MTSLIGVARENACRFGGRTAAVCGAERLTYADLYVEVERLASALHGNGVNASGRIVWLGQNCHRLLELVLAADLLGATVFPINWRSSVDELTFAIDDVDPDVAFWQSQELAERAAGARSASSSGSVWICIDTGEEWREFLSVQNSIPAANGELGRTTPLAIFTSAYSGKPAAALLASGALVAQALLMGQVRGIDHAAVTANVGPMFHLGVWLALLPTFVAGGTNVIVRRVDPEELCRTIERERCTHAYLVAATQSQLVEVNREGRYDLRSLRSADGSPEWLAMVSADQSPWAIRPGVYGQTETTGIVAFKMIGPPSLGNAGWPSPLVEITLRDEDRREVPQGEIGEIAVRGSVVMSGYFGRPDRNANEIQDGWRFTNDLGRREADGSLSFVGPKGRMLKSGLENVYGVEVENALRQHSAVRECAVIGVPDPNWKQRVKAIVVAEADVTPESLIAHCRKLIAGYKTPRLVEFVDELPRTDGGEVDYAALDARHGGGGYPGENRG